MRENRVKRALKRGEVVIGTMISEVRGPGVALMLGTAGFDYVYIDMEHSTYSMETVGDIIMAAQTTEMMTMIRVPGFDSRCALSRPLDAGADGLLCPQVESVEDVEWIIRQTKYYPMGQRGMALRRGHSRFAPVKAADYMTHANEETMIVIQIESEQAVNDIEKLVSVPGVDAAFIGPADLSQSYGIPGQAKDPRIIGAIERVIKACDKYGVAPGIHLYNMDDVRTWVEKGMRLICYSNDIAMITDSGKKYTTDIREYLETR